MAIIKQNPLVQIRQTGVPLCVFETADPAQTIKSCVESLNGKADQTALVVWDIQNGHRAYEKSALGTALCRKLGTDPIQDPSVFLGAVEQHSRIVTSGEDKEVRTSVTNALIFIHNGDLYLKSETFLQGVWNLRDSLKSVGATMVILCTSVSLPPQLQQDVVVVTEPLPTPAEVEVIARSISADAGLDLKKLDMPKIVDTLLGVSAFAAEQVFAMSITKTGLNMESLFSHRRKMIEQTPGLTVFGAKESFADIGGCANVKNFVTKIFKSKRNPVRAIGWIDEIEKMLPGNAGDLSGVSQDQLMVLLTEMQDANIPGMIFIGPPGCAKSAIAKASGSVADAEVIKMDMGAMTGSLVGESQAKIRKALATFKAVSQGKGIFIATCNKIAVLPPELRRRFKLGTFFFDLPDAAEREAIWKIWMKKFEFDFSSDMRPDDTGWTGAEIQACSEVAWRMESSLIEAAKFIVPVSVSAAPQIEALRTMASGCFISASKPGIYEHKASGDAPTGRRVKVKQVTTAEVQGEEQE